MSESIKALIIDDEAAARDTLAALLREFFPEISILGMAKDGNEGLVLVKELQPELVFLDVEMPGLSGIEMMQQVTSRNFEVIFTTAHKSYTLDAIKLSALDYLLKPIGVEELSAAILKVRERKYSRSLADRLRILEEHLQGVSNRSMRIALPAREGLELVNVSSIIRCEGDNNYTHFYFEGGKKLLVSKTLREYERLLSEAGFYRIFQSHLVNLYHVKEYVRGRGGNVKMTDGTLLTVSRDRKKDLLSQLSKLS